MAESVGGTESTSRVADVLLLFVEGPSTLGVTRIARELGLSKAVVHRILQSLAGRDMVVLDPVSREYRLGPLVAALGARALRESDLRTAALPLLRRLRDETRETATLSTPVPHGRVYLDQVVGLHEIKMTVELGLRVPVARRQLGEVHARPPRPRAPRRGPRRRSRSRSRRTPRWTRRPALRAGRVRRPAVGGLGRRAPGRRRLGGRTRLRRRRRRVQGAISVCGPARPGRTPRGASAVRAAPCRRAADPDISRGMGWP